MPAWLKDLASRNYTQLGPAGLGNEAGVGVHRAPNTSSPSRERATEDEKTPRGR